MVGLAVGGLTFLIMTGIRASHKNAMEKKQSLGNAAGEQAILESLRGSDQDHDADLLEKIFGDRDAIRKHSLAHPDNKDAVHTLELVASIVEQCCSQSEELQDLVRRSSDPLLDAPVGAEQTVDEIRSDLKKAYQAIADARSRLRRGERLEEADFLNDQQARSVRPLSTLTSQLEEETAISRRIEERVSPEYRSAIVFDETEAPDDEGARESQSD